MAKTSKKSPSAKVEEALIKLLHKPAMGKRFRSAVSVLTKKYGGQVYVELFHLSAHLSLTPKAAKTWWVRTIKHADVMTGQVGREVDFRTALLDMLTTEKTEIRGPKIIDLRIFMETEKASITDGLTQLKNRRHFQNILELEVKRSSRYHTPLTLMLVDVDDFKKFNDRYGHMAGDLALIRFSRTLEKALRDVDVACRYGGEEFAAILPQTDIYGAQVSAGRLLLSTRKKKGPKVQGKNLPAVTVSIGLATLGPKAKSPERLIYLADMALYQSKAAGKNTVSTSLTDD